MTRALTVLAMTFGMATSAFAMEGPPERSLKETPLGPAKKYSGRTPIDLKNGIPFNNGTYGLPNENYEKWASTPSLVPSVSELPYPFDEKQDLINGLNESATFIETAIFNWKRNGHLDKPEVKAYADESTAKMQSMLDAYKETVKKTADASKTDWEKAQADARRSLVELRATYSSLHRNVH